MNELVDYVVLHTNRGACQCGRCFDAPDHPETLQPTGHTADLIFFKVSAADAPVAAELKRLVAAHKGVFNEIDLLDGAEHNYLEVGGWLGSQEIALLLMGLGTVLGLWKLLTPHTMFGNGFDDKIAMKMAEAGYVAIKAP